MKLHPRVEKTFEWLDANPSSWCIREDQLAAGLTFVVLVFNILLMEPQGRSTFFVLSLHEIGVCDTLAGQGTCSVFYASHVV